MEFNVNRDIRNKGLSSTNPKKNKGMKKKNRSSKFLPTILFMSIIAISIIYLFYYINTSTEPILPLGTKEKSELEIISEKDLDYEYPATPSEVLRLYYRITRVLYNEDLTEEQTNNLVSKLRQLFDKELIENNPLEDQLKIFTKEKEDFKDKKYEFSDFNIMDAKEVLYWSKEEVEYAAVIGSSSFTKKNELLMVYEEYIFRRDEDGRWKIVGWQPANEDSKPAEDETFGG